MQLKAVGTGENKSAGTDKFTLPFNKFKLRLGAVFQFDAVVAHLLLHDYRSYRKPVEVNPDVRLALEIKREFGGEILYRLRCVEQRIGVGADVGDVNLGTGGETLIGGIELENAGTVGVAPKEI